MDLIDFEIDAEAERSARNGFFVMSFLLVAFAAYQGWTQGGIDAAVTVSLVTGQIVYWASVLVQRRRRNSE